jgi:predicted enzyme related to lactoylglutathione lyase
MTNPDQSRYPHGSIAWTELAARDVPGQEAFYARLLGWRFDERHRARSEANGKLVAGIRGRRDEDGKVGGWMPFIAVDDVSAVARAVVAAGGQVHRRGEDVVLEDPLGGVRTGYTGDSLDRGPG